MKDRDQNKVKIDKGAKYGLLDLFMVSFFTLVVYSSGIALGWFIWGYNANL